MAEKHLDEAFAQATHIGSGEDDIRNTKSSTADVRDMARMGKPQEMKVDQANDKLSPEACN